MKKLNSCQDKENGAVLLTTLLLMTIMAAIAVSIIDNIRFSIRRAANMQIQAQLDWYARGGEAFSQNVLKTFSSNQKALAQNILSNAPINFPFEDGGMSITVYDANNCFNLNSLADKKNAKNNRLYFERLLIVLDFDASDAVHLSSSIQDWVDEDNVPNPSGAESVVYSNLKPPYQAANRLMADRTELREISGIDEVIYQRISPFVCVFDHTNWQILNVNTLTREQAPLLANVLGGEEGLVAAQGIISDRPTQGYASTDQVWNLQIVQDLELKGSGKDQVSIKTDNVRVETIVTYQQQVRKQHAVFELGGVQDARLVSRRRVY